MHRGMPTRRRGRIGCKREEETAGWLGKVRGGVGKRGLAEEQPKLNDPLQARALTELVGSFSGHRIVHREKGCDPKQARLLLARPLHVVIPAEQLSSVVAALPPLALQGRWKIGLGLATALRLGGGFAASFGLALGRSRPIEALRKSAGRSREWLHRHRWCEHKLLDGPVHCKILINWQGGTHFVGHCHPQLLVCRCELLQSNWCESLWGLLREGIEEVRVPFCKMSKVAMPAISAAAARLVMAC